LTLRGKRPIVAAGARAAATLSGTARGSTGQALAGHTAQLRNAYSGQVIAKTLSTSTGSFSFASVPAASYVVELLDASGHLVGTSAVTPVAEGSNVAVAVQAAGGIAAIGISRAVLLAVLAAGVGIGAVVVANRAEASPVE
jgi:hypothetical protein